MRDSLELDTATIKQMIADRWSEISSTPAPVQSIDVRRPLFIVGTREGCHITVTYGPHGSNSQKEFWLKRANHPRPEVFLEHRKLSEKFSTRSLPDFIPKPYAYWNNGKHVLVEFIPGKNLRSVFLKDAFLGRRGKIARYMDAAGQWLGTYHRVLLDGGVKEASVVAQQVSQELTASNEFHSEEKDQIQKHINACRLTDLKVPVVRSHNDFAMRNILIDGEKLTVVDWDSLTHPVFPKHDIIWNDLSTFLVNLQNLSRYVRAGQALRTDAARNFLGGYEKTSGFAVLSQFPVLHYLTALRYFMGTIERPLRLVYPGRLQVGFVREIKHRLLAGPSAFGFEVI